MDLVCVSEKKLEFIDWPSHPDAWRYRTRLRAALGKPPDFAGRYVVVLIGCGTGCEWVALIDVETGRVHFAPFATSLGSSYRADSRLFIDSPPDEVDRYYRDEPDMPRTVFQTNYYVWDESRRSFEPVTSSGSAPATRPRPVKSSENAVQAVSPANRLPDLAAAPHRSRER